MNETPGTVGAAIGVAGMETLERQAIEARESEIRNAAFYRGKSAGKMSERSKWLKHIESSQDLQAYWRARAKAAEGQIRALISAAPTGRLEHYFEQLAELRRDIEQMAGLPVTYDVGLDEHPIEPTKLITAAQVPIAPEAQAAHTDPLMQLILNQNWQTGFTNGIFAVPLKGVVIHKITAADAEMIGTHAKANTGDDFPLCYALGCLCIESVFDVLCQNGNFIGSNKTKDPCGYDVGVAQLKLRFLIGSDGITDVFEAHAFACDPTKAIPYFAREMRGKLKEADELIKTLPETVNPAYRNRFLLATGAYNFGSNGMKKIVSGNQPVPSHCAHVAHLEAAFAQKLGLTTVMPAGL